jgi:hypothetical protein
VNYNKRLGIAFFLLLYYNRLIKKATEFDMSIKNNSFDDLSVGLDYILKQSKTFFSKGQDLLN